MIYILSEDDSLLYLDNPHSWDAFDVEERVLRDLEMREVTEPVAVLLSDRSATCFYVTKPGVIL